jgi:hypothetical protein
LMSEIKIVVMVEVIDYIASVQSYNFWMISWYDDSISLMFGTKISLS